MTQPALEAALLRASAVRDLVQGEVKSLADACITLADAANPLSQEAQRLSAEQGLSAGMMWVPQDDVDHVVILSQTCDLQVTTPTEYHCLVAPVLKVSEARAHEASRGRLPAFAALPWLDRESVADLSRITTIERSLLVDVPSLGSPNGLDESRRFADTVSRYLTRPALPDHVNEVLRPFLTRMRDRYDRNSPEGRCMNVVAEFRLEGVPDIEASQPALTVLMVFDESECPTVPAGVELDDDRIDGLIREGNAAAAAAVEAAQTPAEKREAWTALGECWIQPSIALADSNAEIGSVDFEVLNGEEMSYARSRRAPLLDLQYLSTRAA